MLYNYKFNGMEYQDEMGLNLYDMPFRDYDPAIGRWTGMDPVLDYDRSPYNGYDNNPVFWADPSGADVTYGNNSVTATGADVAGMYNAIIGALSGNDSSFTVLGDFSFDQAINLPEVEITVNRKNWQGAGALAQMHVYSNSSFYDSFWKDVKTENMNGFQREMDGFGALDPTGIIDGINALIYSARGQHANATIAALGIIPYIGDAAKVGKYTKSTMKMGREVHATYKAAEEAAGLGVKEFRGIPGIRPDFVDFTTKTIFELKPFNPRAMKAGEKQLAKYKAAFETEYPGTIWETVLDTY